MGRKYTTTCNQPIIIISQWMVAVDRYIDDLVDKVQQKATAVWFGFVLHGNLTLIFYVSLSCRPLKFGLEELIMFLQIG